MPLWFRYCVVAFQNSPHWHLSEGLRDLRLESRCFSNAQPENYRWLSKDWRCGNHPHPHKMRKLRPKLRPQRIWTARIQKYCKSVEKRKLRPRSEFPPRQLTQTMVRVNCQNGDGDGSWVGEKTCSWRISASESTILAWQEFSRNLKIKELDRRLGPEKESGKRSLANKWRKKCL